MSGALPSITQPKGKIDKLPVSHKAKARITYCQFLAAVRQERMAIFMESKKCLCENAEPVFGFRELEKEADTKSHMKYLVDEDLAWRAPQEKARLEVGACKGIYMAPLDWFDRFDYEPSVVFLVSTPYQAYHILNDYMGVAENAQSDVFPHPQLSGMFRECLCL